MSQRRLSKIPPKPSLEEITDLTKGLHDLKQMIDIDGKGRYYTWDELRYRVEPEKAEQLWFCLKVARSLSSQRLPFPPVDIQYVLTGEISQELHLCDQELSKVLNVGRSTLDSMPEYIAEALSDEAIYSSKLEGAVTTELVAREMLRKNLPPKTKDEQMIVNNHHAMQFIRGKQDVLLTPEFLCEIHRIVTEGTLKDECESGRFRTSDDVVVRDRFTQEVLYYPPKAADVAGMVEAVCDLANLDRCKESAGSFVHPLIVGIALHFLIGYIHPFYDGNGRTARTLFYWYVLSRGYLLFEYIPISKIITQSPAQYRDAYLATEGDDMDLTYFLVYNISCIRKAREMLAEYLHSERERTGKADRLITSLPDLTRRQGQILRYMLEYKDEEFGIREIADRFSVAYQTARTDLMHLEACKYLWMRKRGKAQYYIVDEEWVASVQGLIG